jgi:threonine dehydrogenase-like Zn-dependent dehydrogenase
LYASWRTHEKAGADITINPQHTPPVEAIMAATSGRGVNIAADKLGSKTTIAQAVELAQQS